jgi:hypothetical protein
MPADVEQSDEEVALLRSADLIGQLGDPHYIRKANALFYEFEEAGLNRQLGYEICSTCERSAKSKPIGDMAISLQPFAYLSLASTEQELGISEGRGLSPGQLDREPLSKSASVRGASGSSRSSDSRYLMQPRRN